MAVTPALSGMYQQARRIGAAPAELTRMSTSSHQATLSVRGATARSPTTRLRSGLTTLRFEVLLVAPPGAQLTVTLEQRKVPVPAKRVPTPKGPPKESVPTVRVERKAMLVLPSRQPWSGVGGAERHVVHASVDDVLIETGCRQRISRVESGSDGRSSFAQSIAGPGDWAAPAAAAPAAASAAHTANRPALGIT